MIKEDQCRQKNETEKSHSTPLVPNPPPKQKTCTTDVQKSLVTRQEMQQYVAEAVTAAASVILEKMALKDEENWTEIKRKYLRNALLSSKF